MGNVPVKTKRKKLRQFFSPCGAVESVRLRSIAVAKPKQSKRVRSVRFEGEMWETRGYPCYVVADVATKFCFWSVSSRCFDNNLMSPRSSCRCAAQVAYITGDSSEKRETCNAYVVFVSKESIEAALEMNGEMFQV